MNAENPALNKRLTRRQLPAMRPTPGRVETFEPRLALSATAGADLLVGSLQMLQEPMGRCEPLPVPVLSPAAELYQPQSAGAEGQGTGATTLINQAAAARDLYGLSGAGQTVAVIDSGIAWDHSALGPGFGPGYRVVGGWDFAEGDADPYDDGPAGFHGTHVGGLIVGDSESFTGIAPGADLVGLRVFDDLGRSSLDWIESALQWVYDHRQAFESPITTVNLSIGALLPETLAADIQGQLEDELRQLREASIVVVAAAGNGFDPAFPDRLNYPASSANAWPVASTDLSGDLSSFSQREDAILATVGRGVRSSVPDHVLGMDGEVNDYHVANGTSMSSPQIAAASMLVREALHRVGGDSSPEHLLSILRDSATPHVDAVTGHSYLNIDLAAAIAAVLGSGDGDAHAPSPDSGTPDLGPIDLGPIDLGPIDLGIVQWKEVELRPNTSLHMTAAQDGLFSIGIDPLHRATSLRISDHAGNVLWNGPAPGAGQIDIPVAENQSLRIHASNIEGAPVLRLANVLGLNQGHLKIASGPSDPSVGIDLSNGFAASIGELRYQFPAGAVTSGLIDGGERADQLTIQGSDGAARLILNPYADGSFSEGGVSLVLRGFEEVRFDGGGGGDRAFLYDTRGDDNLVASPGTALLEGVGFRYEVSGVSRTYVHATSGGQDMAFLNDSAGDDRLAVRPQFVSLRGGDFFNLAYGFERVYAYATAGGADHADLYDSAGDDRLTASAESAMISGPGYYVQARQFDSVTGHAVAGGHDRATLYADDSSGGRWVHTADQLTLRTAGGDRTARGFESLEPYRDGVPLSLATLDAIGLLGRLGASSEPQPADPDLTVVAAAIGPPAIGPPAIGPPAIGPPAIGGPSSASDAQAPLGLARLAVEGQWRERAVLESIFAAHDDAEES